jgi:hypothetical protein
MAILSHDGNEVEVNIKRHPQQTYFDEYVKVGDREKRGAESCERYIVPEPGTMYTIEVTLKRGFRFGSCQCVEVSLWLPGQDRETSYTIFRPPPDSSEHAEEDMTRTIEYADFLEIDGRPMKGARLAFRDISIGQCPLSNSIKISDSVLQMKD